MISAGSPLSEEDEAIKQQVEADTNVFSDSGMFTDLSEPEYPLTVEQQTHVSSTKLLPTWDGYRVPETVEASTLYGERANSTSVKEADEFFRPIAEQAIRDGYTEEEIEAKIGVKKYHADVDEIDARNKFEVDTIIATHSEFRTGLVSTLVQGSKARKERSRAAITDLENKGYILNTETQELEKDGNSYSIEASFAKVMETHESEMAFGLVAGMLGGPQAGFFGDMAGNMIDNAKMRPIVEGYEEGAESVTNNIGDTSIAQDLLKAPTEDIVWATTAAAEGVAIGKALTIGAVALSKTFTNTWEFFSVPTKEFLQDISGGNINSAYDYVINKASSNMRTEADIIASADEYLSLTKNNDWILALDKSDPTYKQAVVFNEMKINPEFRASINSVMGDMEATENLSKLIYDNAEAFKTTFAKKGTTQVLDDMYGGKTFKANLDRSISDVKDLLSFAENQVSVATRNTELTPEIVNSAMSKNLPEFAESGDNIQAVLDSTMTSLRGQVDELNSSGGLVPGTNELLNKVAADATNLKSVDDVLNFRRDYNQLLSKLRLYDKTPYTSTMKGRTVEPKDKADRSIAFKLKDTLDGIVDSAIDASPISQANKDMTKKNLLDSRTLADGVYRTEATELYKNIAKSGNHSEDIADAMIKNIGSQGGDYARIMSNLSPEQGLKFEENLINRVIDKSIVNEGAEAGLVNYRQISARLSKLKNATGNEGTRNTIDIIDTFNRVFGREVELAKTVGAFVPVSGIQRGIHSTVQGVMKYTMIGLLKHFTQMNYQAGKRLANELKIGAPISLVGKVPIVGRAINRLDKTMSDYAMQESVKFNAIQALKRSTSVDEFVSVAESSKVVPDRYLTDIKAFADALRTSIKEGTANISKTQEETDIWIEKKIKVQDDAFLAREQAEKAEEAFIKDNIPSLLQTNEARLANRAKLASQEAKVKAKTKVEDDVIDVIPSEIQQNALPERPQTFMTTDANGNPVASQGGDKGWGANRNVTTESRTAEQDILDTKLNPAKANALYGADILNTHRQLPPSKTIVTPQTEDAAFNARMERARDMPPHEAFKTHPVQPKVGSETYQGKGAKAQEGWAKTMSDGEIPTTNDMINYNNYLYEGAENVSETVIPEGTLINRAVAKFRQHGIALDDRTMGILDVAQTPVASRKGENVLLNKGDTIMDGYDVVGRTKSYIRKGERIQSSLNMKEAKSVLDGTASDEVYAKLQADIEQYNGMFGITDSATSQIDMVTGGLNK